MKNILQKLYNALVSLLALLKKKKEEPKEIPEKPVEVPKKDYLNLFCLAIQEHEGWYNGSRSFRNNNPGNLKDTGNWKLSTGRDAQNFAIFKTYEDGFNTLKQMILNIIKGYSKYYKPDFTLLEFFSVYAPKPENDSVAYASFVQKKLGVDSSFRIKDLTTFE